MMSDMGFGEGQRCRWQPMKSRPKDAAGRKETRPGRQTRPSAPAACRVPGSLLGVSQPRGRGVVSGRVRRGDHLPRLIREHQVDSPSPGTLLRSVNSAERSPAEEDEVAMLNAENPEKKKKEVKIKNRYFFIFMEYAECYSLANSLVRIVAC